MYNFDKKTDRCGTNSLKWDIAKGELPMWVADMDFETAPEIISAIKERAEHGIFGYSIVPDEWHNAITYWWETRHNFHIENEWSIFCTGVIPALSSIVRKMTTIGENVLIQTPVYNIFYNSILNNGRHVLENPLNYKEGIYSINWQDLEDKLANPQTSMMILCNPQNPAGKIWDRETLARIGELCFKYNVLVVSDEIHCDLTDPGRGYIPFASVSDVCKNNSITCIAPTKTFNIAGIQTAAVIVPNEVLRHKVDRGLNTDEVAEPNSFAVVATIAAYTKGSAWLDELRQYIYDNKQFVKEFIENKLPQIKLVSSEATYLLWLDFSGIINENMYLPKFIREKTGLFLSEGKIYGGNGADFLRMNIACPRDSIKDGLNRLKKGIEYYEQEVNI